MGYLKLSIVVATLAATAGYGAVVERTDCSSADQGTKYFQSHDVSGVAPPPGHAEPSAYVTEWTQNGKRIPSETARWVNGSEKVLEKHENRFSSTSTYSVKAEIKQADGSWAPVWMLCYHWATKVLPPTPPRP